MNSQMFREISAKEVQSIVTKRMWVLLPEGYRWYSMVGTIEDIHRAKQAFGDSDAFYSFFRAEDEPLIALVGVDDVPVQMSLF